MDVFPEKIFQSAHREDTKVFRLSAVNPAERLTADEQQVGPNLYRRRIDFGLLPDTTEKTVAHGIEDLDVSEGAPVIIEGTISDGSDVWPLEMHANVTAVVLDATNIGITTDADLESLTAVIFITYSKSAA